MSWWINNWKWLWSHIRGHDRQRERPLVNLMDDTSGINYESPTDKRRIKPDRRAEIHRYRPEGFNRPEDFN